METADITEQQLHEKGQYQQDFDLIEGGICFVLADGSERVVFANRKAALLYECEDAESFLQFCAGNYQNLTFVSVPDQIWSFPQGSRGRHAARDHFRKDLHPSDPVGRTDHQRSCRKR